MNDLSNLLRDAWRMLVPCVLLGSTAGAQAAVSCSASMTNVSFGNVDLVNSVGLSTTATLSYSCTNNDVFNAVRVRVCFAVDGGQTGQAQQNPSYMTGAGQSLAFDLFAPGGAIWGTPTYGTQPYSPPVFTIAQAPWFGVSSNGGSATMQGAIRAGQLLLPGSYSDPFTGNNTAIAYSFSNGSNSTPPACGANTTARFPFTASATVIKNCTVTANPLTFPTPTGGALNTNLDSTTLVQVTCSPNTSYNIGLSNGLNAIGNTRRMAKGNGEFISYELHRDGGYANPWGNTVGTNTVSGSSGVTGTAGSNPGTAVYGRVTPQAMPSSGTYTDTITVTVTY